MKIAVVGLGLIGGSFCKAISKRTPHSCFGIDINKCTIQSAISDGAIEKEISPTELKEMDMTIVCLHPEQTIEFILENLMHFKKGSVVIDSCGVKGKIINSVSAKLLERDVTFIGCHPMAGREFSGYNFSLETLFDNASFIITPSTTTPYNNVEHLKGFAKTIGFKKIVITTADEHDKIIAFTSQLAHIVSSAYIKSPTLNERNGFSAGSFLDLTRVAKLNEDMWTALFLMNKAPLIYEIDTIIKNLEEYREVIINDDSEKLNCLLKEGRILKEQSDK